MTTCAVYCRISDDREGKALGVDRQERACRKLARERGWRVGPVFTDNDISAYSGRKRPGYEALLSAIQSGQVGALVVMDADRLHRQTKELERFIDIVDAANVRIETVHSGEVVLNTADGRLNARLRGAVARHESEKKAERIKAQREDAARKGEPNGGIRAFGYTALPEMKIVPKEANAIRKAVAAVLDGTPVDTIAREWNARGLRAVKGGEWTGATVKQCLVAPKLAGLRTHHGASFDGTWTAIISRTDHERVKAHFDARKTGAGRPPTSLLGGGLLVCGKCGATMQSGGTIYKCFSGPGAPGCGSLQVRKDVLEGYVVEKVLALDYSGAFRARARRADGRKPVANVGTKIAAAEQRLIELGELFGDGTLSKAQVIAATAKVNAELDSLRGSLSLSEGQRTLAPYVAKGLLQSRWPSLDRAEQRKILAAVIDHLVIQPSRSGPKFSTERVEWHLQDA